MAKLALNIELDKGNDEFVGTKAVTREEACLYAFNTLTATMVEYDENTQIAVGDVVITTTSKAKEVTTPSSIRDKLAICDDKTVQFAEKYFGKLSAIEEDETDSFGRPAVTWKYDGDKIGTYAEDADEVLVLNETDIEVKDALTGTDFLNLDADDFVKNANGMNPVVTLNGKDNKIALTEELNAGDKIEVFENDNDEYAVVVITRYEVASIDDVEDELSNADVKKGASYAIDLESLSDDFTTSATATLYDKHDTKPELNGFDAKTYVKDAVLAIVYDGEDVLASNVAETVEGKITAYKAGVKATITVGGTKYPVAGAIQGTTDLMDFDYDDSEYTLYLDPNGYVIGLEGDTSVDLGDVYLVTNVGDDEGRYGATTTYAQAVALKDGSIVEFKLDDDAEEPNVGFLYTFDEDDGKYTAELYEGEGDNKYERIASDDIDLAKDDTSVTYSNKYYFEDDTTFLKVEKETENSDPTVKVATGSTSVAAEDAVVIVIYTKDGKACNAAYVVILAADIGSSLDSSEIVYFKDDSSTTNKDGREAEAYFMDGTGNIETITYDKDDGKYVGGKFFKFSVDDDGIYDLTLQSEDLTGEYKDETGFVYGATLTKLYKNALTAFVWDGSDYVFTADDIDLGSKVIIIDEREDDERDEDLYKSEITNASRLQSAINKEGVTVEATVFFDDEEVIFIAVTDVTDAE